MLNKVSREESLTVDLETAEKVTEGVITVNKVVEYAKDYLGENELYEEWNFKKDGASRISRLLFEEATEVTFIVKSGLLGYL